MRSLAPFGPVTSVPSMSAEFDPNSSIVTLELPFFGEFHFYQLYYVVSALLNSIHDCAFLKWEFVFLVVYSRDLDLVCSFR